MTLGASFGTSGQFLFSRLDSEGKPVVPAVLAALILSPESLKFRLSSPEEKMDCKYRGPGKADLKPLKAMAAAMKRSGKTAAGPVRALVFRDARKSGRLYLAEDPALESHMPPMGLDFFDLTPERLLYRLGSGKAPVKTVITDQRLIAGLGDIYATEILFEAKVSPLRPAEEVSSLECFAIFDRGWEILERAVHFRGSSVAGFTGPLNPCEFTESLRVYGRKGKPCPRCETPLSSVDVSGTDTVYCPVCQK
jgi:DNA-formamidopyrimidine glycosylase